MVERRRRLAESTPHPLNDLSRVASGTILIVVAPPERTTGIHLVTRDDRDQAMGGTVIVGGGRVGIGRIGIFFACPSRWANSRPSSRGGGDSSTLSGPLPPRQTLVSAVGGRGGGTIYIFVLMKRC